MPSSPRSSLGAPGKIRTCDFRFRRPALYPAELRAQTARTNTMSRAGTKPETGSSANQFATCVGALENAPVHGDGDIPRGAPWLGSLARCSRALIFPGNQADWRFSRVVGCVESVVPATLLPPRSGHVALFAVEATARVPRNHPATISGERLASDIGATVSARRRPMVASLLAILAGIPPAHRQRPRFLATVA